jgi:hypothetical protein
LSNKRIVVWRWAKPSKMFDPTENPYFEGPRFKSHNVAVRAGLNPVDWMEMIKGEREVLHKIVLTRRQAENCVVAEADFLLTEEEITEFVERRHILLVGSKRKYDCANYEKSFVCLLEYSGNYNLPEVLIPFSVKADVVSYAKLLILIWKLKMWIRKKMNRFV